MVQLTEGLVADLDDEAATRGMSRSALISLVLTQFLNAQRAQSVGQRIADGYRWDSA